MKTKLNYLLCLIAIGLFIGIALAISTSSPPPPPPSPQIGLTPKEIAILTFDLGLPRQMGTMGTQDSVTYSKGTRTLFYNSTIWGYADANKYLYRINRDKYYDMVKYFILEMDDGFGFASLLEERQVNLGYRVFFSDGDCFEWKVPGKELLSFADSCKMNPTEALKKVIDLNLEIANLHLPIRPEDLPNQARTVISNAIIGDEKCLLQSVSCNHDDIVLLYDIDDIEYDLDITEHNVDDMEFVWNVVNDMARDDNFYPFIRLLAKTHTNMILMYEGRNSHKRVSMKVPNSLIVEILSKSNPLDR